jgi:hypothetical protein
MPNNTDHVTGLKNPLLGWHFSLTTALDVLEGAIFTQKLGWTWQIFPNPDDPTSQRMSMIKTFVTGQQPVQIIVNNTQWFAIDSGGLVQVLEAADVTNNYTVTSYVPPA